MLSTDFILKSKPRYNNAVNPDHPTRLWCIERVLVINISVYSGISLGYTK